MFYNNKLQYYNNNRDIVDVSMIRKCVCWSFPTLDLFKKNIDSNYIKYYNIFLVDGDMSTNEKIGNTKRTPKQILETYTKFRNLLSLKKI